MGKTPIQKAIEKLTEIRNLYSRKGDDIERGAYTGYTDSINYLQSLLPYEKQFMQGEYERGWKDGQPSKRSVEQRGETNYF